MMDFDVNKKFNFNFNLQVSGTVDMTCSMTTTQAGRNGRIGEQ